jgi:CheY-like chemotaxis protein
MTPEVVARAFDPFFTTKLDGKGTGLGLSMVYGFAKQSGGHAKIYSEPGHGTTVKLYLPRSSDAAQAHAMPGSPHADLSGRETILAVEDDEDVRRTVVEALKDLGYHVVEAANGADALVILETNQPIDLLFTDIVMPGSMSGRELADDALKLRPDLKILFTSGYTENAIIHHGRLDPGTQLLSKPYRHDQLAAKIRGLLGDPVIPPM